MPYGITRPEWVNSLLFWKGNCDYTMKFCWGGGGDGGGIFVSLRLSVRPSVLHAMSALWLVAYFMDYIHMWHKYNP